MSSPFNCCSPCAAWQFDFYGPWDPQLYEDGTTANANIHNRDKYIYRTPAIWPEGFDTFFNESHEMVDWSIDASWTSIPHTGTIAMTLAPMSGDHARFFTISVLPDIVNGGYNDPLPVIAVYNYIGLYDAKSKTRLWEVSDTFNVNNQYETDPNYDPPRTYGPTYDAGTVTLTFGRGIPTVFWRGTLGHPFAFGDGVRRRACNSYLNDFAYTPFYSNNIDIDEPFWTSPWMPDFTRYGVINCNNTTLAIYNGDQINLGYGTNETVSSIIEFSGGTRYIHYSTGYTEEQHWDRQNKYINGTGTGYAASSDPSPFIPTIMCPKAYPYVFAESPAYRYSFSGSDDNGNYQVQSYAAIYHGKWVPGTWNWFELTGTPEKLVDYELVYGFTHDYIEETNNHAARQLLSCIAGDRNEEGDWACVFVRGTESWSEDFFGFFPDDAVVIAAYKHHDDIAVSTADSLILTHDNNAYGWSSWSDCKMLPATHRGRWPSGERPGRLFGTFKGKGSIYPSDNDFQWTLEVFDMENNSLYGSLSSALNSGAVTVNYDDPGYVPQIFCANDKWMYVCNFPQTGIGGDETIYTNWRISHDCTLREAMDNDFIIYDDRWHPDGNQSQAFRGGTAEHITRITDCVQYSDQVEYPPLIEPIPIYSEVEFENDDFGGNADASIHEREWPSTPAPQPGDVAILFVFGPNIINVEGDWTHLKSITNGSASIHAYYHVCDGTETDTFDVNSEGAEFNDNIASWLGIYQNVNPDTVHEAVGVEALDWMYVVAGGVTTDGNTAGQFSAEVGNTVRLQLQSSAAGAGSAFDAAVCDKQYNPQEIEGGSISYTPLSHTVNSSEETIVLVLEPQVTIVR